MKNDLTDIIIVDDHKLFRQSLKSLLRKKLPNTNINETQSGEELLNLLDKQKYQPDIILLDLEMPGMNGLEVVRVVLSDNRYSDTKIIILTMHDKKSFILELIEEGVHGYVLKDADISEIIKAIRQVQDGQYYVSQRTFEAIREDVNSDTRFKSKSKLDMGKGLLSPREEEILMLICDEYTNKEMAEYLKLSVRTIDGHRNRLLKKTGMKNTAGLVKYALRSGFYSLS